MESIDVMAEQSTDTSVPFESHRKHSMNLVNAVGGQLLSKIVTEAGGIGVVQRRGKAINYVVRRQFGFCSGHGTGVLDRLPFKPRPEQAASGNCEPYTIAAEEL